MFIFLLNALSLAEHAFIFQGYKKNIILIRENGGDAGVSL